MSAITRRTPGTAARSTSAAGSRTSSQGMASCLAVSRMRAPKKRSATRATIMPKPRSLPLVAHLAEVSACRACPDMIGPVITPRPVADARVYLVGQAPGPREGELGRPFAWTAGKQLFRWFEGLGVNEESFRSRAYIAAMCRCFPGKTAQGGDRVPSPLEVERCSRWMRREIELLRPELVIPVGKLAIATVVPDA